MQRDFRRCMQDLGSDNLEEAVQVMVVVGMI